MKLTIKQLLLFVAGGSTGAVGSAIANSATAHAEVVRVKSGDTTWQIAKDHETTVKQIVKDNNLKDNGNLIYENQELEVNKPGETSKQADASTKDTSATTDSTTSAGATQQTAQAATTGTQTQTSGYSQSNNYASSSASQGQGQSNTSSSTGYTSSVQGSEKAAKEWIAQHESGGSYTARNASSGAYGRYQLLPGYLNGDYSAANQERTADNYVKGRYGSWTQAQAFWQSHGWY